MVLAFLLSSLSGCIEQGGGGEEDIDVETLDGLTIVLSGSTLSVHRGNMTSIVMTVTNGADHDVTLEDIVFEGEDLTFQLPTDLSFEAGSASRNLTFGVDASGASSGNKMVKLTFRAQADGLHLNFTRTFTVSVKGPTLSVTAVSTLDLNGNQGFYGTTVRNNGDIPARNVTVRMTFPTGFTATTTEPMSLASGESNTWITTVTTTGSDDTVDGTLEVLEDDIVFHTQDVSIIVSGPVLSISVPDSLDMNFSSSHEIPVVITNTGNGVAHGVTVTIPTDEGFLVENEDIGEIPAGDSWEGDLEVTCPMVMGNYTLTFLVDSTEGATSEDEMDVRCAWFTPGSMDMENGPGWVSNFDIVQFNRPLNMTTNMTLKVETLPLETVIDLTGRETEMVPMRLSSELVNVISDDLVMEISSETYTYRNADRSYMEEESETVSYVDGNGTLLQGTSTLSRTWHQFGGEYRPENIILEGGVWVGEIYEDDTLRFEVVELVMVETTFGLRPTVLMEELDKETWINTTYWSHPDSGSLISGAYNVVMEFPDGENFFFYNLTDSITGDLEPILVYPPEGDVGYEIVNYSAEGAPPLGETLDLFDPGLDPFGNTPLADLEADAVGGEYFDANDVTGETPVLIEIDMFQAEDCVEGNGSAVCTDRHYVNFHYLLPGNGTKWRIQYDSDGLVDISGWYAELWVNETSSGISFNDAVELAMASTELNDFLDTYDDSRLQVTYYGPGLESWLGIEMEPSWSKLDTPIIMVMGYVVDPVWGTWGYEVYIDCETGSILSAEGAISYGDEMPTIVW